MRITAKLVAVAALALLAASCDGSTATPCTTCPNVQGTYHVVIDAKGVESSTCDLLYVDRYEGDLELYQTGSKLEMPLLFGGMEGVLYDDDSARFGPVEVAVTNTTETARVVLNGAFTGTDADRRFSGSVVANAALDEQSCTLTTTLRMTRAATSE